MVPRAVLDPALGRLAEVLNRNLELSTPGRAQRERLAGRSFAVAVAGLELRVRVAVESSLLTIAASDEPADAEVRGAPLALLALLRESAPPTARAGVTISGDPEIAQAFQALLKAARPELEAEFARAFGDVPARLASRLISDAFSFADRVRRAAVGSTAEYLTEESRDLPAKAEAEQFLGDVDRLRDDVERASARLARLEERARLRAR